MKALVSGGNRGLGIEICRIILANSPGSHVFMGCRDLESGREIAKKLSNAAKNGGRAEAIRLDVSSEQSVEECAATLSTVVDSLDLVVNNAGILHEEFSPETALATMQTNFEGAVRVTEACLPLLRKTKGAQVLFTSSGMGARILGIMTEEHRMAFTSPTLELPTLRRLLNELMEALVRDSTHPYHASVPTVAYSLSKLGVNAYAQILARQHMASALRSNACSPGFTNTGMCANYTGSRKPKDVALGASVFEKVLFGELGESKPTGLFFKESSKADTPLDEARSVVDAWVQ